MERTTGGAFPLTFLGNGGNAILSIVIPVTKKRERERIYRIHCVTTVIALPGYEYSPCESMEISFTQ